MIDFMIQNISFKKNAGIIFLILLSINVVCLQQESNAWQHTIPSLQRHQLNKLGKNKVDHLSVRMNDLSVKVNHDEGNSTEQNLQTDIIDPKKQMHELFFETGRLPLGVTLTLTLIMMALIIYGCYRCYQCIIDWFKHTFSCCFPEVQDPNSFQNQFKGRGKKTNVNNINSINSNQFSIYQNQRSDLQYPQISANLYNQPYQCGKVNQVSANPYMTKEELQRNKGK